MAGGSPELGIESETEVGTKRTGCLQTGLGSPRLADTAESGGLLDRDPVPPAYPGRVHSGLHQASSRLLAGRRRNSLRLI